MQINIFPPIALCEKGRRPVNEDFVYPHLASADSNSRTFLVCDGVGGASKGELASQIVAETFGTDFDQDTANLKSLHKTLHRAQAKIDDFIYDNRQHKGMATTMTFLQLNDYGAIIAHAGDSRVYHIRGNKVLFCTYDHSLVNDLIKMGKWEEAKTAKSNVITRAIQGEEIRSITLDVQLIEDVQPHDYFFLCSDGVWSALADEDLLSILNGKDSEAAKMEMIRDVCIQYSRDNYSAYLVKVKNVLQEETNMTRKTPLKNSSAEKRKISFSNEFNEEEHHVKVEDIKVSKKTSRVFFTLFLVIGIILTGLFYGNKEGNNFFILKNNFTNAEEAPQEVIPVDTVLLEENSISNQNK